LTARGAVNFNGGAANVSNADVPSRGVTIDAGGALVNADNARLSSVPGTPGSASVLASDPSLSTLDNDRMFVSVFGMDRATYRAQPAAVRLTCAGDCAVQIAAAVSANPGRVIWVEGPVTIDSNQVLGTAAQPVMLVVSGNLTVSANLQLHGVLYLHGGPGGTTTWTTTAGSTLIQGGGRRRFVDHRHAQHRIRSHRAEHDQLDARIDGTHTRQLARLRSGELT
jgi:hypothetical protein